MATVQNLIDQLNQIENKEQSVIFQYFLAEHFEYADLDVVRQPTAEEFDQAVEDLDDSSLWDDPADTINDYVFGLMSKNNEEEYYGEEEKK
jgi:hypothetical protein